MGVNYELAKELKDAGFVFIPWWTALRDENEYEVREIEGGRAYVLVDGIRGYLLPTLSELIEACENTFKALEFSQDDMRSWHAYYEEDGNADPNSWSGFGSTPEEAVARLWLALNKK